MQYTTKIEVKKGNPKAFFESLSKRKEEAKKYIQKTNMKTLKGN